MATPPVRTEISDTYPLPSNATARTGFGKLYDYVTGLLGSTGNAAEARVALGVQPTANPSFTGSPLAPTPPVGTNSTQIATTEFARLLKAGQLVKSVGGGVDVTLTTTEAGYGAISLTGVLTANINVVVPNVEASWFISNATSGAFTLTVKTATGNGIVVSQGKRQTLVCDSVNVYQHTTELLSPYLAGTPTTVTAPAGDNSLQIVNTAFGATLAPPGQVAYFGRLTAPTGWLKANGAWVSRTTYANLFASIGTTFGAGDGSTTFTLPDLRGEFIRSLDDGRGVDASRVIGFWQSDALQGHWHDVQSDSVNGGVGDNLARTTGNGDAAGTCPTVRVKALRSDGVNGTPRTAAETRPRNIALLACIKY